jgi:hypothetical protein
MLTSFVLTMALAAPVPATPAAPVTGGVAPRLLELKADADGKVMVTVRRTTMEKVNVGVGIAIAPGGAPGAAPPAAATREIPVTRMTTVELADVKDLKVTTADGKPVDVADAVKQLKSGAVVVVSADGKSVSPNFLKVFKDDTLVLTAQELAGPVGGTVRPGGPIGRPVPPVGIQPLPAPVQPQVLPANPGGAIQIQIQPGQIQVIPLNPAPAPVPAPEK